MLNNTRNAHRMGGKMDEKWTGPYEVVKSLSRGCYKLKATNGKVLKKSYNSTGSMRNGCTFVWNSKNEN